MHVLMMLEAEHDAMRKLLDVAEVELDRLDDGLECDRALLAAIAGYWRDYPDECHHPKEGRVLRALVRAQAPGAEALAERIDADHERLDALGDELVRALGGTDSAGRSESGGALDDEALAEVLRHFVAGNREHMTQEEARFFPFARRHLSEADWTAIDFDVLDRPDPIFDRAAEARFRVLRDAILEMSERRAASDHARRLREHMLRGDPRWLGDVATVERFNAVVGREVFAGDVALRPVDGGGFALELGGIEIAAIPACEESRAAWCAFFFLLGAERGYPARAHAATPPAGGEAPHDGD